MQYNYKMPKLDVQIIYKTIYETNFTNLCEVSEVLRVPKMMIMKFITTELSTRIVGNSAI